MSGLRRRARLPSTVLPIALAVLIACQAPPVRAARPTTEPAAITLEQAAQLAAQHAPSVDSARGVLQAAEAELAKARTAFNLTISANASTTGSIDAAGLGGTAGGGFDIKPTPGVTLSAQANATTSPAQQTANGTTTPALDVSGTWQAWPPSRLSSASSDLATAQMNVMNATDQLALAKTLASLEARRDYQNVQIDMQRTALARAAATAAQTALEHAGAQARHGDLNQPDLLQTQIDAANAQLDLQTAADTERSEWRVLLRDTGLEGHTVALAPFHATSYEPATIDQASLRAEARRHDATLLAAQRKVDIAKAELSAARAQTGLAVDLQTNLTWASFQAGPALSVGLSASYAVDDGGVRRAAIADAEATLAHAQLDLAGARTTLDDTLQQQIDAIDEQALKVRKLTLARDRARLLYRQAQDQAEAGAITSQDLGTKLRETARAQLDLDAAVVAYQYQAAILQQAPGENPP